MAQMTQMAPMTRMTRHDVSGLADDRTHRGTVGLRTHAASGRQGEWRSLLDGKTTAGWRGYRQKTIPDGWTVVDGALTRAGKGGDIITADQFGDFELTLEYNVAPGANSGVFFRVTEDDPVIWHEAPEIQVIDNARTDLKPEQAAGANYDLHAPSRDVTKPAGQWNALRILVKGDHVEQWLNGD